MLPYARSGCDMAAITSNEAITNDSAIASAEDVRAAFGEHKRELTWLAEFLTDDELIASACVADARELSANNHKEDEISQECVQQWPREATIRSALDVKRARIAELSAAYEHVECGPRQHTPLSLDKIELMVRESEVIRRHLDSLCRFVLVLCGVEHRCVHDVACLLGISKHAIEAAYDNALELLEVIYCQAVLEAYGCAAA